MIVSNVSNVRERRVKAGLSMRALARVAGVHFATISNIEKPKHNVSPATAKAVCDALNSSFDELFVVLDAEAFASKGTRRKK